MSFFVKPVVCALKTVPRLRHVRIEGDQLIEHHYYILGVAAGTRKRFGCSRTERLRSDRFC